MPPRTRVIAISFVALAGAVGLFAWAGGFQGGTSEAAHGRTHGRLAVRAATTPALTPSAIDTPSPRPDKHIGEIIPGHYVIQLRDGADLDATIRAVERRGARIGNVYRHAIIGFAGNIPPEALAFLRSSDAVRDVEPDRRVSIATDQSSAPWGLDRIDQPVLPLNGIYTYDVNGAGVKAYVIDTGILTTNTDFGGRAIAGVDEVGGPACQPSMNSSALDFDSGHGTHVAGTVGGTIYGVAKGVTLVSVRVLNCQGNGSNAQVIQGVDWVTGDHLPGQRAVANMSLGGGISSALDTAVANSVADGVVYVVAAGNSSADACNSSPSREPSAITLGATDMNDARASFSNFGSCLDLFAPGVSIPSDWNTSTNATEVLSGTSMATPHVAGIAALFLSANPAATPAQVTSAILANAKAGVVTNLGTGSPNLLAQSRVTSTSLTIALATDHADPADFPFVTTGTDLVPFTLDSDPGDTTLPSSITQHLLPGHYTITQQTLPSRWHATAITCSNGAIPNLAARSVALDLGTNVNVTCTFTYAEWLHIKIVQESLPADPQAFDFTATPVSPLPGSFQLSDTGGDAPSSCVPNPANSESPDVCGNGFHEFHGLSPGAFTFTQGAVSGWNLSRLVCDTGESVNLGLRKVDITLTAGKDVTCTFSDTKPPVAPNTITIVEAANPADGQDFPFTANIAVPFNFTLDDDSTGTFSDSQLFAAPPGTYSLSQGTVSGWALTEIWCNNGASVTGHPTVNVTVAPGDHIVCVFQNVKLGSITIIEDTVPNGPTDFTFSGGLGAFTLDDDPTDGTYPNTITFTGLVPQTYAVTESQPFGQLPDGLIATSMSCSQHDQAHPYAGAMNIVLDPGASVTCTFTNRKRTSLSVNDRFTPGNNGVRRVPR